GTATYDGLSIAWATLEHLHDINRARALFATHYHEMTALSGRLSGVENATVAVKEWDGDVIFLHEVQKGAADRSYGVQVAKLAGLPSPVIDRAKFILAQLEQGQHEERQGARAIINDLPLFAATPTPAAAKVEPSAVVEAVDEIMPDELTPREALDLIYRLKELREGEGGA
ncbi:MAG: DNA mismatch repair protein MutS, partial [Pseudomonadota bacterium]